MNILVLPNAFKGSLSAAQAALLFKRGLGQTHTVRAVPVSDGGDGFIEFFQTLDPHAKLVSLYAKNAFLKKRRTGFLLLSGGKTAVVETARVCGLGRAKKEELDALGASSYGVGEVLLAAAKAGAKTIYVGLGGVACSDGGAGMAAACGARISDKNGHLLPLGAAALLNAHTADFSALEKTFKGITLIGVADVTNPLLGPKSSAKVFGPQKGATPAQVKQLDKALGVWAHVIKKATGREVAYAQSTAAAGAIAAGLAGCFGAELLLGADFLFQKAGLEKYFKRADLVITTEGKLDRQTFYGKAPLAVLKLSQKYKKPTLFICGQLDGKALRGQKYAPEQIAVLADFAPSVQDAQKNAAKYLRRICKSLASKAVQA